MTTIKHIILGLAALMGLIACNDKSMPENPVLTMPITSLVLEVSGEDFTAVPNLDESNSFTDELSLSVKIPSSHATVKAISLQSGYTTDIAVGDKIEFTDNKFTLNLTFGCVNSAYTINMLFNPPPIMYVVKTSDRDEIGTGYYLDIKTQDFIASANYDNFYEGELNLSKTNWDNVGLVSQDLTTIYNVAAGPWPPLSHYTWTALTKAAKGDGYFSCDGPWNDWKETNGNADIVSPGIWRVIFDSNTLEVEMTMTQWAVTGNSIAHKTAMVYNEKEKAWSLSAQLKKGEITFETIPVAFGDPVYRLGHKDNILGMLSHDGSSIKVEKDGTYDIKLTLSNPPYYLYEINLRQ